LAGGVRGVLFLVVPDEKKGVNEQEGVWLQKLLKETENTGQTLCVNETISFKEKESMAALETLTKMWLCSEGTKGG